MSSDRTRPPLKPGGSAGGSAGSSGAGSGGGGGAKGSGSGSSSSAERPRSSRSNNPSSRGDNYHGFAATTQNLRPITHDKVGYPLLCYLHDKDWAAVFPEFTLADLNLPSDQEKDGGRRHWQDADGLLHREYHTWIMDAQREGKDPHEKKLTENIAGGMRRALRASPNGNNNVISQVLQEHSVKTRTPEMSGFVDVVALGAEGSPVLLVEVGLLNDDWWKKLDQGLMYAPGLKNFAQPILFVVLTLNVIKGDPRKMEGGRMGVFLVSPRSDFHKDAHYLDKFRMSLLRRVQTGSLTELSETFGRVLRAAYLLPGWNATATSSYRYLGPSCCRFTSPQGGDLRVLRVYDNRFMHTDRRPDLYLDPELGEGGEVVCHILDRDDDALPFGARVEGTGSGSNETTGVTSSSREWLWERKGQFLAISVPHYRGRHYAKNIMDFKPILRHLKRLHEHGCVHGDVRGFNMVIVDEHEGHLIDLDYGGRVKRDDDSEEKKTLDNYPKYPEGYKIDLPDGFRMERESRSPITAKDDVFALAQFMFTAFRVSREGRKAGAHLVDLQEELAQSVEDAADNDETTVLTLNDALSQFADEAKWDLVPTLRLRRDLEKFGCTFAQSDSSVERSVATFPATGSPSKRHRA